MLCEVRVFHFRKADDSLFGQLKLRLDCVGIAEVEVSGLSMEQIAAQAWIEVVGPERRAALESLPAPQVIVQAPIDRDAIASELQDTPTACHVLYGFVYDNQAETWLIELDSDFDFWSDAAGG